MDSKGDLRLRKPVLEPISTVKSSSSSPLSSDDEPLSPGSLMFHEPDFNVHVMAIMGCKTEIYPDVVKSKLVDTLLKHPRFSTVQVIREENGNDMVWRRTTVNLDDHVIVPNLNNISEDSSKKFVEDYISNLTKTTLDKSKPLWELHLLNIKTSDANAFGIFKIHHSLGDGTSLMSLLLACTRQISNPEALPTIPFKKKTSQGSNSKFTQRISGYVFRVLMILRMFWNTIIDLFAFIATGLYLKDTDMPLKNPPGVEFTPRRFIYRTVSLDDMKLIKNAMNATINDVALGVTQAGLSRYLNRKYAKEAKKDAGATEKHNNLPKNIRLRSTLLINLRPSGIQELADVMEKNTKSNWGNWIGYVLLPFTIALRDDPLDYVREAKATVDRKKRSFEAIVTFTLAEIILKLFGIKWAGVLSHRVITNTTLCFSNLVGPIEEIGFYGHPLAFLAPGSYGQPHGLMINFQSYINKMTIVLSVDESTVPDPQLLCDDLEESLNLIKDAVVRSRESN